MGGFEKRFARVVFFVPVILIFMTNHGHSEAKTDSVKQSRGDSTEISEEKQANDSGIQAHEESSIGPLPCRTYVDGEVDGRANGADQDIAPAGKSPRQGDIPQRRDFLEVVYSEHPTVFEEDGEIDHRRCEAYKERPLNNLVFCGNFRLFRGFLGLGRHGDPF